jgi:uncharacterized SAM-binding protein YcdF (DUF218 family)
MEKPPDIYFYGPFEVIGIMLIYLIITITSIYLILKNENKHLKLIWVLLCLMIPFLISVIYIGNFLINNRLRREVE